MAEIVLLPEVTHKLDSLAGLLFDKGYFAIMDNAFAYVDAVYDFIYTIANQQHYPTAHPKYGAWYSAFRANKHTTWYIIFDKQHDRYIVRNIINNHTSDYPAFIRQIK
jgi:hypothetical protein